DVGGGAGHSAEAEDGGDEGDDEEDDGVPEHGASPWYGPRAVEWVHGNATAGPVAGRREPGEAVVKAATPQMRQPAMQPRGGAGLRRSTRVARSRSPGVQAPSSTSAWY